MSNQEQLRNMWGWESQGLGWDKAEAPAQAEDAAFSRASMPTPMPSSPPIHNEKYSTEASPISAQSAPPARATPDLAATAQSYLSSNLDYVKSSAGIGAIGAVVAGAAALTMLATAPVAAALFGVAAVGLTLWSASQQVAQEQSKQQLFKAVTTQNEIPSPTLQKQTETPQTSKSANHWQNKLAAEPEAARGISI